MCCSNKTDHYLDDKSISYQFITSQWQKSEEVSLVYLLYRWSIALSTTSVVLASIINPKDDDVSGEEQLYWSDYAKWFIFATHWGYLAIVFQSLISLYLVQKAAVQGPCIRIMRTQDKDVCSKLVLTCMPESKLFMTDIPAYQEGRDFYAENTKFCKLYRIIYATAFDMALAISIVFWTILHKPGKGNTINFLMHGSNVLVMAMEALVVGHVVSWWDAIPPALVGATFVTFSGSYYLIGGTDYSGNRYIYHAMDWSRWPTALAFGVGSIVATVAAHALLMLLQVTKQTFHRRCCNKSPKISTRIFRFSLA